MRLDGEESRAVGRGCFLEDDMETVAIPTLAEIVTDTGYEMMTIYEIAAGA